MSNTINAVNAAVAGARSHKPSVVIRDIEAISSTSARVIAQVTHTRESRGDNGAVFAAIAGAFDNKLTAVEPSFRCLSKNNVTETVTGIVGLLPEAQPYTEGMDGFQAVAGNMFMDDEDKIWALRQTEAGSILVKTGDVNSLAELNDLMTGVASANNVNNDHEFMSAVASDQAVRTAVEGGTYISYINAANEPAFGVVCASVYNADGTPTDNLAVLAYDGEEAEMINRQAVVEAHSMEGVEYPEDTEMEATAGAKSEISVNDVASYYSRVFQRNPDYFNEFMNRWKGHFGG